ncbi:putative alpha-amylase [Pseudovirgaria hyperparasitica]|uniref:Putative alpha-amylase n=1 Tax=Pseudovirgaria hyperparasitica TaxID=470096 RepID=A0A6A6W6Q1_9PEZI|nr:putative alpha-amylase [Pseudovirgaria hyperparasitica]KAF2757586.1 putative alpha-amylase [Pseudovirgaria hyperparasitica]
MTSSAIVEKAWWKEAVVYQIYPASFLDSNDDGLGDIPGVISKVAYIKSLGVDAIWLSPVYTSPQKDMGYDISDYRSIHAPYGTVEDMQTLINVLHDNQMRLLMDLVVNHTSDQHDWFKQSRSSRESEKRGWYFWRDAKIDTNGNRKEPNNWRSIFGGSAWHWDETTQQYYLALFLPSQPDLNWSNPEMRRATYDDMRFWLDRGVDGFRIDSMNLMSKHPDLPDGKVVNNEPFQDGSEFFASGPKMHNYIREMRTEVFDNYDCMTVGELGFTKDEQSVSQYVAKDRHELNMVFTGDIVDVDFGPNGKYERTINNIPRKIREITDLWQQSMPKFNGWNSVYYSNHDSGRPLTRYASDSPEHRAAAAKMLAMYLLSLGGTPFLLQGDEIGMANLGKDYGPDAYIDVEAKNYYISVLKSRGGNESTMDDVLREMQLKSRDHGRLPMQWDSSVNAGFASPKARPWMTINKDYTEWNVASQINDPNSVFSFWRTMLTLRKQYTDLFVYGSYKSIPESVMGEGVIGFERAEQVVGGKRAVVFVSFSEQKYTISTDKYVGWDVLVTNHRASVDNSCIELGPFGALLLIDSK